MVSFHWSASASLGRTPRYRRVYLHECLCNHRHHHHPHGNNRAARRRNNAHRRRNRNRHVHYVRPPTVTHIHVYHHDQQNPQPQQQQQSARAAFEQAATKPPPPPPPQKAKKQRKQQRKKPRPHATGPVSRDEKDGRRVVTWPTGWSITMYPNNATVMRNPHGEVTQITAPNEGGPLPRTEATKVEKTVAEDGSFVYTSSEGYSVTDYRTTATTGSATLRDPEGKTLGREPRSWKGKARYAPGRTGGNGHDGNGHHGPTDAPRDVNEEHDDMVRRLAEIFGLPDDQPLSGKTVNAAWMKMDQTQKDAAMDKLLAFLQDLMGNSFGPDYPVPGRDSGAPTAPDAAPREYEATPVAP